MSIVSEFFSDRGQRLRLDGETMRMILRSMHLFLGCFRILKYLTLSDAELEEVKGLRILEVTLDSKLTFETYLREVVSKAIWSPDVVRQAGK